MALTKCKECGKDVSTKAMECPYCGAPVAEEDDKPQGLIIVVSIIFLAILIIFIFTHFQT